MKRLTLVLLLLILIALPALVGLLISGRSISPVTASASTAVGEQKSRVGGGQVRRSADGFAGYGWSTLANAQQAVAEAVSLATGDMSGDSDITMVFYSPQHKPEQIHEMLRDGSHPVGRVFGMSTHEGVLCADGYHTSQTGVIGVLAMRLAAVTPGVGGASFDEASPPEAAKLALRRAITDAGQSVSGMKPALILLSVTLPNEEQVLAALAEETGPGIPLIGGTAAGSIDQISRKKMSNWSMIANDRLIKNGLAVVVFYSTDDIAWSYGGGFRRTSTCGVITKCQPRLILEIDGRPAVEVYDKWLGGRVTEAAQRGENVINFCTLYPLCQTLGSHNQFIRVWPSDDPSAPGSLRTGVGVQEGDTVYLSEGDWNILLNHFATIPQKARDSKPNMRPMAGLFIYCGGAMECIPKDQRQQMATLVGHSMNDLPWMGIFTWGEQGNVPGVGNVHSSLSSCTVLFPQSSTAPQP